VETVAELAGKEISVNHVDGPVGVQSRNFSNARIESLGWKARYPLRDGIGLTYPWIDRQVHEARLQTSG
jgi:nucleoside-diphosphate-sugar epimerase